MSADVSATPPVSQSGNAGSADAARALEIDRIIKSGRVRTLHGGRTGSVGLLALLFAVLHWVSFAPLQWSFAAWFCLIPLLVLIQAPILPRRAYGLLYAVSFLWGLALVQWMRHGHQAMYGAVLAMGIYLAIYPPLFVCVGRLVYRSGVPLWLSGGLTWTALEYLRAHLITGFPWYFLGHTQYRFDPFVQISDITGAYGVSFIVVAVNGLIAMSVAPAVCRKLGLLSEDTQRAHWKTDRAVPAIAIVSLLVAGNLAYGMIRLQQIPDPGDGPVVALIQGNFTPEMKHDPDMWRRMVAEHDLLSSRASSYRPDLIVWPETMFPVPDRIAAPEMTDSQLTAFLPPNQKGLNSVWAQQEIESWRDQQARKLLTNRSQEAGAAMMIGLLTEEASSTGRRRFNSAAFFRPDLGYVGRYDKIHRVIFGEYIPLRSVFPWLAQVTPFSAGFGIDAGSEVASFEYDSIQYAPIICFEDTVPHLVRQVVNGTDGNGAADVLVNMTNDGWFRGSSELDQHLITSTFRCIETRRPMVRAVNAGISAFIDSAGRVRMPDQFFVLSKSGASVDAEFLKRESLTNPETGAFYRQVPALMVGQIPLDGRPTVYLAFGDWFSQAVCFVVVLAGVIGFRKDARRASPE